MFSKLPESTAFASLNIWVNSLPRMRELINPGNLCSCGYFFNLARFTEQTRLGRLLSIVVAHLPTVDEFLQIVGRDPQELGDDESWEQNSLTIIATPVYLFL